MKFLPRREPIDSFGDGGFRFGGMSHRGALLILPSGMRAWNAQLPLAVSHFDDVFAEQAGIDVLLIGTGARMLRDVALAQALDDRGVMADMMTTSAAIHSYNIMLAENRRVAVALLPVDAAHG